MNAGEPQVHSRDAILVVDDNVDAADSLALLLERDGFRVVVAYDGRSAVEQFDTHRPNAVIMDIGLPIMDGYETARLMRQRQGDTPLLIIALTGWGHADDRKRSSAAGFDHHLVKTGASLRDPCLARPHRSGRGAARLALTAAGR